MDRRDPPSFEAVYEEHVWDVHGFVSYRVRSREAAEDLTQQTFEKALSAWPRFDPERASARTWLLTIARNAVIDHHRRDRSDRNVPIGSDEGEISEGDLPAHGDQPDLGLSPELAEGLAQLSERAREVLALRFGGDLNGPEIAEVTGLTVANVQQILSRSLRALLESLGDRS